MSLNYRTFSQILKLAVIPQVTERRTQGKSEYLEKPLNIQKFRYLQWKENGNIKYEVEINDEFELLCKLKLRPGVKVEKGDPISTGMVDGKAWLPYPKRNEKRVAFFFAIRQFMNYIAAFDFTPNDDEILKSVEDVKENDQDGTELDLEEFSKTNKFLEWLDPIELLQTLSSNGWPPSPGYFPLVLRALKGVQEFPSNSVFLVTVETAFDIEYFERVITQLREYEVLGSRISYFEYAVKKHFENDYVASIHTIIPQFEGIIRDYITRSGKIPKESDGALFSQFEILLTSREISFFSPIVIKEIIKFLTTSTFRKATTDIKDPTTDISRHGVVHGCYVNFENRELSMKLLILMDGLTFLILHDQIVSGLLA